jgi:hypothetical protein
VARSDGGDGAGGMPLAQLQELFYDLVTWPTGVERGLAARGLGPEALGKIVAAGDDRLPATARLDIYASMYFHRILDVLRAEYPRVLAAVGDDPFHDLITDYLLAARPAHASLREAGARLPGYLASGHALAVGRPWLPALARLERTHRELSDGPDAEPLVMATLQGLAPEAFVALEVRLVPSHAVLEHTHALAPVWAMLATGEAVAPVQQAETLLVWRRDFAVLHRAIDDPVERTMLGCAASGATLAALCETAVASAGASAGAAELAPRAFQILARWTDDGLLSAAGAVPC